MGQKCGRCCRDFCGPSRRERDFDPSVSERLPTEVIFTVLYSNAVSVVVGVAMQATILAIWLMFSLVPGFALYDGAQVTFQPVSNIGWWAVIELFTIIIGCFATGYRLSLPHQPNRLEFSVTAMCEFIIFYWVVLAVDIIANSIHMAMEITEISYCTSTLCVQQWGFLLGFIIMLGVLAFVVDVWLVVRSVVYYKNLQRCCAARPKFFDVSPADTTNGYRGSAPAQPPQPSDDVTIAIPPAQQQPDAAVAPSAAGDSIDSLLAGAVAKAAMGIVHRPSATTTDSRKNR
jgi:hypothetical protein